MGPSDPRFVLMQDTLLATCQQNRIQEWIPMDMCSRTRFPCVSSTLRPGPRYFPAAVLKAEGHNPIK